MIKCSEVVGLPPRVDPAIILKKVAICTNCTEFQGVTVLKSISASELRAQIKRVINEVSYGQTEYIVEKFGEPTAAIINIEDYRLLQEIKQQRSDEITNERRLKF